MIPVRILASQPLRIVLVFSLILITAPLFSADWTEEPPELSEFDNPNYQMWLPGWEASPATSVKLNDLGFQAYLDGNLVEAAKLWKAALQMDPDNPWPQYNFASVLAVFAGGFGDFDAPGDGLPKAAMEREDFWDYRTTIIRHLKNSIRISPERLSRGREDSDFDSIRELPEFVNVLMGPNPDVEMVISKAPKWYSLQAGAFLPEDILTFFPNGQVVYEWDAQGRLNAFPEYFTEGEDESFTGTWSAAGNNVEITTHDGRRLTCKFAHKTDEFGFIVKRILIFDGVKYGDYDAHYWEGQDG